MRETIRSLPPEWIEMQKKEVSAWVKAALKRARIPYAKASRSMGLPKDAISKVARGERELSATEMAQIAEMTSETIPTGILETGMQPRYVKVIGEVAAGLWRDVSDTDFEQYDYITLVDTRWPSGSVLSFLVKGESINKRASDGDHVIALLTEFAPRGLQNGDWVIADRIRHDLRERTVKRARCNNDGEWELWPFSDDPRYQEPLLLGEHDDESVLVVAFVLDFVSRGTRF